MKKFENFNFEEDWEEYKDEQDFIKFDKKRRSLTVYKKTLHFGEEFVLFESFEYSVGGSDFVQFLLSLDDCEKLISFLQKQI